jgi:hypothetical protein
VPNLADTLPEFARNRTAVLRDLHEKQTAMFEEWAEQERQRELDRINKIIAEANDVQKIESAAPPTSDLAEFQKALERSGEMRHVSPSLESRIRSANDK